MELKDSMYWYFVSFTGTNKPYPMQYNLLLFNIMIDRLANCVNRVIAKLIPLIRTRRLHPRVCSSSHRCFHPITMIWKTILYLILHYHYPRTQHTIYHSSESESMRANWTDDLRHSVYIYIYICFWGSICFIRPTFNHKRLSTIYAQHIEQNSSILCVDWVAHNSFRRTTAMRDSSRGSSKKTYTHTKRKCVVDRVRVLWGGWVTWRSCGSWFYAGGYLTLAVECNNRKRVFMGAIYGVRLRVEINIEWVRWVEWQFGWEVRHTLLVTLHGVVWWNMVIRKQQEQIC